MKQFNREVLEVDKAEDKVQLTIFKANSKSKEFVVTFAKSLGIELLSLKQQDECCCGPLN